MLLEERYIDFICEHKLTQGQFLLLYLMYKKRGDLIVKYKKHHPTDNVAEDKSMIGEYWVNDLIKREYIVTEVIDGKNTYQLANKFRKAFCNPLDIADELVSAYPSTMEIDGKIIPLTAIDTVIVAQTYGKAIMESQEEHLEVLKDIEYGKENNLLSMGLKTFINSKYWLALRKKRLLFVDGDNSSKQNNTFG